MSISNLEASKRLAEVIRTEAVTTDKADFLLTHAPFEALYLNKTEQITEEELLNRVLLSDLDSHKFIMIQGGNGTGKSHLIRWLKEKYESATDQSKDAVLLISRAHNNLQDALTQLLESGIFPDDVRESTLKHLQSARGSMSVDDFKKLINFKFVLELQNDKDNSLLDKRTKDQLAQYLLNPFILKTFLMIEGGPLDRMRAKIETTNDTLVIDGDQPVFTAEDFAISILQVNRGLKGEDRADKGTITTADRFVETRYGPALREKVAEYLNGKVSAVIRSSMDLKSIDFQHIFEDLRRDLKKKGMRLALFLEDINAFTGIDEALMEAMITDHTAEGNTDCCRLMSVVGSTIWFYENNLNSSIRERVTTNVYLREGSVISKQRLAPFAARYINAINISNEVVNKWYSRGAFESETPLAPCPYDFSRVLINNRPYSIFPFTENALDRLYSTLEARDENNSSRTPRIFLKEILQQVLLQWYEKGSAFLSSEENFQNQAFSIPRWADATYAQSNLQWGEDYATERSLLLRIWGNGTTLVSDDKSEIGGVSKDIFAAFEIPFPDVSAAPTVKGKDNIETQKPENITPVRPQRDDRLLKLERLTQEIDDWAPGSDQPLTSHQDLRDDLARFILSNASWIQYGIPYRFAEACITRRFLFLEGQTADMQASSYYYVPRSEETHWLLLALAKWRYQGGSSWNFDYGFDYLTIAMSWLEKHMDDICDFIMNTANSKSVGDMALLGVAAEYCLKSFSSTGFDITASTEDSLLNLFSSPAEFADTHVHQEKWKQLSKDLSEYSEVYNTAMSFFRKAVGGRKPEEVNYVFVDAAEILSTVEKLRALGWNLGALHVVSDPQKGLKGQLSDAILTVTNDSEKAVAEELGYASSTRRFLADALEGNTSREQIDKTLSQMKQFLKFISDLNQSYVPDAFVVLHDPALGSKTELALKQIQSVCNSGGPDLISLLSCAPFDTVEEVRMLFSAFDNLLKEKNNLFSAGINKQLKADYENRKEQIRKNVMSIQQLTRQVNRG